MNSSSSIDWFKAVYGLKVPLDKPMVMKVNEIPINFVITRPNVLKKPFFRKIRFGIKYWKKMSMNERAATLLHENGHGHVVSTATSILGAVFYALFLTSLVLPVSKETLVFLFFSGLALTWLSECWADFTSASIIGYKSLSCVLRKDFSNKKKKASNLAPLKKIILQIIEFITHPPVPVRVFFIKLFFKPTRKVKVSLRAV